MRARVPKIVGRIGLLLAVVVGGLGGPGVARAGGGCLHGTPPSVGTGTRVELAEACFSPTVISIRPGATVTFVGGDTDEHNVVGVGMTWGDPDRILLRGDRESFRFADQGVFPFACWIHPGMVGTVVVGTGIGDGTFGGVMEVDDAGAEDVAPAGLAVADPQLPSPPGSKGSGWWIAGGLAALAALAALAGGVIASGRRAGTRSRDPQAAGTR